MRKWPDMIDPPVSEGYSVAPVDQARRTEMETGTARARRVTKARRDRVKAVIRLADAEFDAFRAWYGDEAWSAAGDSDDLALWTRTNLTRAADLIIGPDGQLADVLTENTATGAHSVELALASSVNFDSVSVTLMATVKVTTRPYVRLILVGRDGVLRYATVSTSDGSVIFSTGVTVVVASRGSGWYRITITADTGIGSTAVAARLALLQASGTSSYAGDGSSTLSVCEVQARIGSSVFVRTDAAGDALGASGGSSWVLMPLAVGHGVETLEARFTGPWDASALPGLGWEVSLPLEVRNA